MSDLEGKKALLQGRVHDKNEDLKDFMKEHSIKQGKVIDGGLNSKEALIKYIKKGSYDLVAIGSRSTSGFNALLGSVTLTLLKDSPTDILVYVP